MQLAKLQNGSDIRGVAIQTEGGRSIDLTPDAAYAIGRAFARVLKAKLNKDDIRVCMGRDSRLSGEMLCAALGAGLNAEGASVYDAGLATTPAMFMATVTEGFMFDGSVMATASHLPYERNGFKFFTAKGGFEKADIKEILTIAETLYADGANTAFTAEKIDFMGVYAAQLVGAIRRGTNKERPLEGMRIIIDAGNGAGGFYATDVLQKLGADISGSQFLEPDGRFPNHIPNPENEEAMASVCAATVAAKADLGVIFDTDVDRAGCVDSAGREINRNRLVALAAAIALENCPGGTIVTDSITSSGLKTFIEQHLGGVHRRFKRGYKNVINESLRLNAAGVASPLAIETSGHAALQENYFLDDGAYLITKIIIKAVQLRRKGQTLDSLIAALKEPAEGVELRFHITDPEFKVRGEQVIAALDAYARERGWAVADDSCEGIRIAFGKDEGDGWLLLRLSVHDPVMPLNIESDRAGGCRVIAGHLVEFMHTVDGLDTAALDKYMKG